jgi:hypothetical protein
MKKLLILLLFVSFSSFTQDIFQKVYITQDTLMNNAWEFNENTIIEGIGDKTPELLILNQPKFILKTGIKVLLKNVIIRNRFNWVRLTPKSYFEYKSIMPGNISGHISLHDVQYDKIEK